MKKSGFTLIEVLAVIALIAVLSLVVVPTVINQINKSRTTIDKATLSVIQESTYTYIDANSTKFPKKNSNVYCISLQTLVDYGYLKKPVQNTTTGNDIPLTNCMKVTFISNVEAQYEMKTTACSTSCTEVRN